MWAWTWWSTWSLSAYDLALANLCKVSTTGRTIISPTRVTFPKKEPIMTVVAGRDHSIFISQRGRIYVCGSNAFGQLGINETKECATPVLLHSLKPHRAISAAASNVHSVFLVSCVLLLKFFSHFRQTMGFTCAGKIAANLVLP